LIVGTGCFPFSQFSTGRFQCEAALFWACNFEAPLGRRKQREKRGEE